jgi:phage-related protein
MGPLSDGLQHIAKFIADNTDVMTPLVGIILGAVAAVKLWNTVTGLAETVTKAWTAATKLFTAEGIIAQVATKAWSVIQAAFNLVMDANPIMLVVLAIAGLAAGVVEAYQHFGWFRDAVKDAFGTLKQWFTVDIPNFFGSFLGFVKTWWPELLAPFTLGISEIVAHWDTIKQWFTVDIPNFFAGLLNFVEQWWPELLAPFTLGISEIIGHWGDIESATSYAWGLVKSYIITPILDAYNWVSQKIGDLVGIFRGVPDKISNLWDGVFDGLKNAWSGVIDWVKRTWNDTVGGFGFSIPSWVPGIGGESWTVPKLAKGGTLTSGGFVDVGDQDRERIFLPQGATVVPLDSAARAAAAGTGSATGGSGGGVHIDSLTVNVPMQGFADFTNPNAMDTNARRMAKQIRDAIKQVEGSYA